MVGVRVSAERLWLRQFSLTLQGSVCGQQYGNLDEASAIARAPRKCLVIWCGDHKQTPGGLRKTDEAKAFRRKLLLTKNDIWRHLFLTKQRKNLYEEGCYNGEDFEDVKRQWEAKKEYFLEFKRMAATLLVLTWPRHFMALVLTTLRRTMQLKNRRHYMHVDGRQKTVFMFLIPNLHPICTCSC